MLVTFKHCKSNFVIYNKEQGTKVKYKHYLFEEAKAIPQQQIYEVELCFHFVQKIYQHFWGKNNSTVSIQKYFLF